VTSSVVRPDDGLVASVPHGEMRRAPSTLHDRGAALLDVRGVVHAFGVRVRTPFPSTRDRRRSRPSAQRAPRSGRRSQVLGQAASPARLRPSRQVRPSAPRPTRSQPVFAFFEHGLGQRRMRTSEYTSHPCEIRERATPFDRRQPSDRSTAIGNHHLASPFYFIEKIGEILPRFSDTRSSHTSDCVTSSTSMPMTFAHRGRPRIHAGTARHLELVWKTSRCGNNWRRSHTIR
jgi:hypothetical protein